MQTIRHRRSRTSGRAGAGSAAEAPRLTVVQVAHTQAYGGLECQVLALASGLREAGHSVVLAVRRGSWLADQAERQGIPWEPVRFRGLADPLSHIRVLRIARSRRADILHGHARRSAFYSAVGGRLAHARSVATVHSIGPYKGFHLNHAIVAVSSAVRRRLVERGVPDERIAVIHNGVDMPPMTMDRAAVRRQLGLDEGTVAVAMAGRIVIHKGHHLLIEALAKLGPRFKHVDACFIGRDEGPWGDSLRALATRLGLGDRVRFLGYHDDVPKLLNAMDVFVLPSHREALSLSLLEAMSVGLPVIAARTGGVPEVVTHGENGLLFPSADVGALTDRLCGLLSKPAAWTALGTKARHTIETRFSRDTMVRMTERLYHELSGDGPR